MDLRAEVDGVKLRVEAYSAPYSASGGTTKIRARVKDSLGAKIYLVRNFGKVPLYRRLFLRDVEIGAPRFDADWIINANREAHAQAFLDADIQRLVEAVPIAVTPQSILGDSRNVYYEFALRGHEAIAYSENFDTDTDRLEAAIAAAVAIAVQPTTQLDRWRKLAAELDGTMADGSRFKMDGSTRIRFALGGRPVAVFPLMVRQGWRRDRLRTQVSCELAGSAKQPTLHWSDGEDTQAFGADSELVASAIHDSNAVLVRRSNRVVEVALDGNVTDSDRIIAAASIAALLSRGSGGVAGPYR